MSEVSRTRYGRSVKKPTRYEPREICIDDYSDSEDISDDEVDIVINKTTKKKPLKTKKSLQTKEEEESDGETIDGSDSEESEEDASDADDEGNLRDFVVYTDDDDDDDVE